MHFPLHPETPPEGISIEALFAGRDIDLEAMYSRMKGLMDAEGLPYAQRSHTYNSRLAQELGKWADTQPGGEALHDGLYKAFFVDGLNIGDIPTLVGVVQAAGLDAKAALEVLEQRTFEADVDHDWARSRAIGVTGVPTFVAGGYGVVGAQPYEALAGLITKVRSESLP